ncbi:MAG: preprotein translocase subunit SecG [Bacteroidales bacterium]
MATFITILIVLASIFLILIVLVQNSKGGGLASGFASTNQIMGVRKTTDFLEKATWGLAFTIVVLSIISAAFISRNVVEKSEIQEAVKKEAPATMPNMQNQAAPAPTTVPQAE